MLKITFFVNISTMYIFIFSELTLHIVRFAVFDTNLESYFIK